MVLGEAFLIGYELMAHGLTTRQPVGLLNSLYADIFPEVESGPNDILECGQEFLPYYASNMHQIFLKVL